MGCGRSDCGERHTIRIVGFWEILFICLKLAGTGVSAWSWWWILLPAIPVGTEAIKAFFR